MKSKALLEEQAKGGDVRSQEEKKEKGVPAGVVREVRQEKKR